MRTSCTDLTFPLLGHEAALDLIAGMGFDAVDVCLSSAASHVRPEAVAADGAGRWAERVGERIRARGLAVADVLLIQGMGHEDIPFNHPDPARRARAGDLFAAALEFAAGIGAAGVTVLPGATWPGEERATVIDRSVDALRRLTDRAQEAGIAISAEPHLGSWAAVTPEAPLELVGRCEGLRLTVDPCHFVYGGTDARELDPLLPHTRHVHVRGGRPGRLQTSFEDNTIDYGSIADQLGRLGYEGALATEYVWFHGGGPYARCDENDCVAESVLFRRFLAERAGAG
jgi:sugar phosphate isomerase/epimerase